jgi:hypothetical protein
VYRLHEGKSRTPESEPARLVLYLPDATLAAAEELATRRRLGSVQSYCEELLRQAIEADRIRAQLDEAESRRGRLEGLDQVANDPEYLREWSDSKGPRIIGVAHEENSPEVVIPAYWAGRPESVPAVEGGSREREGVGEMSWLEGPASEVVLRHAGLLDGSLPGLLPSLRLGEALSGELARELLRALADLEAGMREARSIDRTLAYALHKIAFEGQVLVSEGWAGAAWDEESIGILRMVQESVDRILSGEDIRYYRAGTGSLE